MGLKVGWVGQYDLQGWTKTQRLSCMRSGQRGQSWVISGHQDDVDDDGDHDADDDDYDDADDGDYDDNDDDDG